MSFQASQCKTCPMSICGIYGEYTTAKVSVKFRVARNMIRVCHQMDIIPLRWCAKRIVMMGIVSDTHTKRVSLLKLGIQAFVSVCVYERCSDYSSSVLVDDSDTVGI